MVCDTVLYLPYEKKLEFEVKSNEIVKPVFSVDTSGLYPVYYYEKLPCKMYIKRIDDKIRIITGVSKVIHTDLIGNIKIGIQTEKSQIRDTVIYVRIPYSSSSDLEYSAPQIRVCAKFICNIIRSENGIQTISGRLAVTST